MTPEKTKKAFDTCVLLIRQHAPKIAAARWPADLPPHTSTDSVAHALWMCEEGKKFVDEGRMEKAMRWLGFVQGALWVTLWVPVETMKDMNKPESEGG